MYSSSLYCPNTKDKVLSHIKREKQLEETEQASEPQVAGLFELSKRISKTTTVHGVGIFNILNKEHARTDGQCNHRNTKSSKVSNRKAKI